MRPARRYRRYIRRLEVEFSANNQQYRGISSNLSLGGIFIRTNHAFSPDTIIHLTIHLPDGTTSAVKGRVRMALRTSMVSLKNGMGIEIIEHDSHFANFVSSLSSGNMRGSPLEALPRETVPAHTETAVPESPHSDSFIISCPMCDVRNRVNRPKISRSLRCGKCGALLAVDS